MSVRIELDQLEDCHDALAKLEPLGARREGAQFDQWAEPVRKTR